MGPDCEEGALAEAVAVAAGALHTCALAEGGRVYCFGRGEEGQLGDDRALTSDEPVAVCAGGSQGCGSLLEDVVALAAGGNATCALLGSGEARCWGTLGAGSGALSSTVPLALCGAGFAPSCAEPAPPFSALDVGGGHVCAASAGGVTCLGANDEGQLGLGVTTSMEGVPSAVCATPPSGGDCAPLATAAERRCGPVVATTTITE
jgi:alpha-tubulin suppressor-like RCC1 family protein